MTRLEQYKKAYATLAGSIDTIVSTIEKEGSKCSATFIAGSLILALQKAEEIFLDEAPEDPEDPENPEK